MTMVRERVREVIDREPFWRKIEDRISNPGHNIRNVPGSKIRSRIPNYRNRNFGGGKGIGIIEAAIAVILSETVGIPFGADADVQSVEPTSRGSLYTVNVNAPTQNMAEARAFIDSGTGFSSVLTDTLRVENVEILDTRTLRDTYQIEVLIED